MQLVVSDFVGSLPSDTVERPNFGHLP